MRWGVVRLIAARETRDLLRDRRTVMLILVLPAVLYPFFGLAGYAFALSITGQTTTIGIVGRDQLPEAPALIVGDQFAYEAGADADAGAIAVVNVPDADDALRSHKADAVLVVPPGFARDVLAGLKPKLSVENRDADEVSKLAAKRLLGIVRKWEADIRKAKFRRANLPDDFDEPFTIDDSGSRKVKAKKAADELRDSFVRVFPFILMMWLIAGAIQPAVDLTAGEKERGTMETLLISPAERTEIVAGKFLATTFFAFASVLWNVAWLTAGAIGLGQLFGYPVVYLPGLLGCVLVALPLAMLFSAVCIALGVFARSTKEGQYYLMPLMLIAMPLALGSMMPGAELSHANALIPVTGAMLLQQKLLAVTADPIPWEFFPSVLGGLFAWVALALVLAVVQFRRESVLFRETGPSKGGGLLKLFGRGR